jgi:hypothetical protein
MRNAFLAVAWLACIVFAGCAGHKTPGSHATQPAANGLTSTNGTLIVTPQEVLNGKVSWVNTDLRFVVITFPVSQLPAVDQHLNVYRRGLKVADVKISGPQTEDSIVADIVTGEVEAGDVVSDK